MAWLRTLRIDASEEAARARVAELERCEAVSADAGAHRYGRTYVFARGSDAADPAEVASRIEGTWFEEPIIALAIEPQPSDALPRLAQTFRGSGAPAGMRGAHVVGDALILEIGAQTSPLLVLAALDCELRRWNGTRKSALLTPLTEELAARVAAEGLQTPEISGDRILETLLRRVDLE